MKNAWSQAKAIGLTATLICMTRVRSIGSRIHDDESGDVPGWVMITLMSAVLVAALLAVAGPRLSDLFNQAINRVSGLG